MTQYGVLPPVAAHRPALLAADLELAQAIIDRDDEVDVLSASLEERCFRLLALQGPMAADLRALAASMRINSDLERSADLAVNIVKGARRIYGQAIPPRLRGIITMMSAEAIRMVRLALDAYTEVNGALGAALHDIDNRLDQLQSEFVEAMFEAHGDEVRLPAVDAHASLDEGHLRGTAAGIGGVVRGVVRVRRCCVAGTRVVAGCIGIVWKINGRRPRQSPAA